MFSSNSSTNSSTFGQSGTPNGAEMSACTAGAEALGAPAGVSLFGGPSIGLFGAPASPLSSSSDSGGCQTPASSASSTPRFDFFRAPTFGRSAPSFGQSTTPAFSQSTTPAFGQSTTSVFGESTLLAFGQSTTPAFGQSAFGQSTVPIFGQSTGPAFGQSTVPVFGQSTAPAFSQSTAPAFGQSTTAAFGDSTTPVFQQTTTPAFRQSTTSASFEARKEKATMTQFGQATKPPFGQPTTPVFWQPIAPTFSQSTMATPYPFGRHSSFFGGQAKPPTFEIIGSGQSTFGGKLGGSKGSRVTYYSGTTEVDYWGQTQPMGKLVSISAMLVYNDKSHEELRWEDYQLGDTEVQKGGSKFPFYAETLEENSGGRLLAMSAMTAYQDKSHEELRLEDYQSSNKGGSNPFAPGTPGSFSFPRSGPHKTGYSWPPAGSSSPGISIWTTSSHKPSVTGPSLVPKSTEAVGPSSYVSPLFSKPQVPSFFDAQKSHSTGVPVPRENPGVVTGPIKEQNLRDSLERLSLVKHTTIHVYENGKVYVEVYVPAPASAPGPASVPGPAPASAVDTSSSQDKDGETNRGTKAADVMELMPKLKQADGYYTQPRIEELAVRESFEPGFCSRVKDFVFGRHGYGSVKFLGETDVRNLDLKSTIQFNDHEVVVYMDESKKTPIGQGLNKPAEITLSNVKCISKGTGKQYIDGPKVDKYKEMLMKAAAEHGAEFVSYDPVQGDWIFIVQHF